METEIMDPMETIMNAGLWFWNMTVQLGWPTTWLGLVKGCGLAKPVSS